MGSGAQWGLWEGGSAPAPTPPTRGEVARNLQQSHTFSARAHQEEPHLSPNSQNPS